MLCKRPCRPKDCKCPLHPYNFMETGINPCIDGIYNLYPFMMLREAGIEYTDEIKTFLKQGICMVDWSCIIPDQKETQESEVTEFIGFEMMSLIFRELQTAQINYHYVRTGQLMYVIPSSAFAFRKMYSMKPKANLSNIMTVKTKAVHDDDSSRKCCQLSQHERPGAA